MCYSPRAGVYFSLELLAVEILSVHYQIILRLLVHIFRAARSRAKFSQRH